MLGGLKAEIAASRDSVLGIMDYRYAPYALGDTFTWLTNLNVLARETNRPWIDIALIALPDRPASGLQPHINRLNYVQAIDGLLPAFFCTQKLRSLRIYESYRHAAQRILAAALAKSPAWPNLYAHFSHNLDYASHRRINAHFERYGSLPRLSPPPGYMIEAERFRQTRLQDKLPVVVNIRQRHLTSSPDALHRDSPSEAWLEFFRRAQKLFPQVVFLLAGATNEWPRHFSRQGNVIIPRLYGLSLGHELYFLLSGTCFMGTSSGFSAAATFSNSPYVITNFEHSAANHVGIPIGTGRYPFAHDFQWLSWERETPESLISHLEMLWPKIQERAAR